MNGHARLALEFQCEEFFGRDHIDCESVSFGDSRSFETDRRSIQKVD